MMETVEMFDDVGKISNAIEIIKKLFKHLKYFYNRCFRRNIKVAVFGDSGVGKSQFLKTITKSSIFNTTRTRRNVKLKMTLKSGRVIEFFDTPGHSSSKAVREVVFEKIRRGQIKGIINIVNYGYQDGEGLNPLEAFNVDTQEVKPGYLRTNRRREIKSAEEFIDATDLKLSTSVKWILVVVNKADIWHQDKSEVMKYYESGNYFKVMESIPTRIKLRAHPFCSVISPYANRPMTISMGEREKQEYFDDLYNCLEALVEDYENV